MSDFIRFNGGPFNGQLCGTKMWPPPEEIVIGKVTYLRKTYSRLTDEKANHPNLARGAEYDYARTD